VKGPSGRSGGAFALGSYPRFYPCFSRALSQARARATELLVGHWSAIERLADLLVDEWKLDGDRLVRLIEAALDNAPDIIAAATEALEREASEKAARKREDVFVVERRLDFERRAAALRARGETGDEALVAAWQEAGDHAATVAARVVAKNVAIASAHTSPPSFGRPDPLAVGLDALTVNLGSMHRRSGYLADLACVALIHKAGAIAQIRRPVPFSAPTRLLGPRATGWGRPDRASQTRARSA
jgi:hypothetical protein